jgi:hypothetical protein
MSRCGRPRAQRGQSRCAPALRRPCARLGRGLVVRAATRCVSAGAGHRQAVLAAAGAHGGDPGIAGEAVGALHALVWGAAEKTALARARGERTVIGAMTAHGRDPAVLFEGTACLAVSGAACGGQRWVLCVRVWARLGAWPRRRRGALTNRAGYQVLSFCDDRIKQAIGEVCSPAPPLPPLPLHPAVPGRAVALLLSLQRDCCLATGIQ